MVLIFDEVIAGFRFRAGDVGALYGVQPDLATFGKIIGGGMPVAAVAGRAEIMNLAGRAGGSRVKFSGGTYSAHPASMLAAKTMMTYLVDHEAEIYPRLAELGARTRQAIEAAFAQEGIYVHCTGDGDGCPARQLDVHAPLSATPRACRCNVPEDWFNPAVCDVTLSHKVLDLALAAGGCVRAARPRRGLGGAQRNRRRGFRGSLPAGGAADQALSLRSGVAADGRVGRHERDVVELGLVGGELVYPVEQRLLHLLRRTARVLLHRCQHLLPAKHLLLRIAGIDDAVGVEQQRGPRRQRDGRVAPVGLFEHAQGHAPARQRLGRAVPLALQQIGRMVAGVAVGQRPAGRIENAVKDGDKQVGLGVGQDALVGGAEGQVGPVGDSRRRRCG